MRIVLITGGFDPLHSGHIAYVNAAKVLGDVLVVGLNSDEWLARKKGQPFMPFNERYSVASNLQQVDLVIDFDDSDGSAQQAIHKVRQQFPNDTIVFANGGDRTKSNIPEMDVADHNIEFVFGVGGDYKANSSSWILQEWKAPKTERVWGYYRVLHEVSGCKVKELTVDPGQQLSMQRHSKRNEHWLVTEGECQVHSLGKATVLLGKHDALDIPVGEWHQLLNHTDRPCRIVEIQYGEQCIEQDIERK